MADRRAPAKWLRWLDDELSGWTADGTISEEQAAAIRRKYETTEDESAVERGGRLVTVLAVLGALLLGVGAVIFFAANWQVIPRALKLALVLGSIIAAYASGYYLAFTRESYPRVGHSLLLLGSLLYGAGIWLVAQMFHLSAHFPDGLLFWMLGILPIAYVCSSHAVLIEASLLLTAWTVAEQSLDHINLLYLVLAALVLALAYRMNSRIAVGLTLGGAVVWLAAANVVSTDYSGGVLFSLLLTALMGLLFFTLGNLHSYLTNLAPMKLPFQVVGLLVFFFSQFMLSFRGLPIHHTSDASAAYTSFFLIALFIICVRWYQRGCGCCGLCPHAPVVPKPPW